MARKISRSPAPQPGALIPSGGLLPVPFSGGSLATLGRGVSLGGALLSTVQSFTGLFTSYLNYLEQKQITRRMEVWSHTVIESARERTREIELQARAFVALAQERRREVEIAAEVTLAEIEDRRDARAAKLSILKALMADRKACETLFGELVATGAGNLTVEDRIFLNRQRDMVQQRLREMESTIGTLAASL
jgi:hypothetical protein